MSDKHTNIRDEQFWFPAAIVGFNTVAISEELITRSMCYAVAASAAVSLLGVHLILTRWLAASHRGTMDPHFNFIKATVLQRGRYALEEIRCYLKPQNFFYVFCELSGSLLYLLLILLSFASVALSACAASDNASTARVIP